MFADKDYWNERFNNLGKDNIYDYIASLDMLNQIFSKLELNCNSNILIVGCGNSPLSEELYDLGYHKITNIDFSDVVIKQMTEKNKIKRSKMTYYCLNACDLSVFTDDTYDAIIDKGTLDTILLGEYASLNLMLMLSELQRVVNSKGQILIFSHSSINKREVHFKRENLSFNIESYSFVVSSGEIGKVKFDVKSTINSKINFTSNDIEEVVEKKEESNDTEIEVICYAFFLTKEKDWRNKSMENYNKVYDMLKKEESEENKNEQ